MSEEDFEEGKSESKREFAALDMREVKFPSDCLRLEDLRRLFPKLFDIGYIDGPKIQPQFFVDSGKAGHSEEVLGHMLMIERSMVAHAYAVERGIPAPDDGEVFEAREELSQMYQDVGIAVGQIHAQQMVRSLVEAGRALAREHGPGKSR